jgi:hypothetical protein
MARVLIEQIAGWGEATFKPPAPADALASAEGTLGHSLPNDLGHVLAESDGVEGEYGLGLVWSVDRIARDNTAFRTDDQFRDLYMPFDGLVFFADAGNGDQFALSLSGNCEVYVWDHETDSRSWVAPSVMAYLEGWMTGRIKV